MKIEKDILTEEDYTKILQNKLKVKNVKYLNATWAPLSDNVEGYIGEHYVIKIDHILNNIKKTEKLFVKTTSRNESQRATSTDLNSFVKECFMYNYLFKEYEKMGYNLCFAPKCYYCKKDETIVMEDLKSSGYKLRDRAEPFDLNHCKAALKSLAYFHANALAYEETKSKELGTPYRINQGKPEIFKEILYNSDENLATKFIEITADCIVELAKFMPESEEWKQSLINRLKNLDCPKIFNTPLSARKTSGHGDLWSNNMLFKYSNGSIDCCLIDYQVVRHHFPSYDALLIIYSNTTRAFRKKHFQELVNYHFDKVVEILNDYGFAGKDVLSREDYLKTAELLKSLALMQAAGTRTLIHLSPEVTNKAVKSEEGNVAELVFSEARIKWVIDAFQNNEKFKKIMMDDVYDFNEHI